MEDEAILLKIKRDFTQDEAIQSLLKIVSKLEEEKGILKSELAESEYKLEKIRQEGTQTKKQWMKDEFVSLLNKELETARKRSTEFRKDMEKWRATYFNLLAKTNKATT